MPQLLRKREKLIIYSTIGTIIFAVIFNLLIAPALTKNENLNSEIDLVRTKLKKYFWLLRQENHIQNKYNKFSSTFKVSEQQEDTLVSALSELENLTKAANIRIIDIRPQGLAGNLAGYKEILIDLRTEGTMEGYLRFIYDLENSLSLLRTKKFQLTAKTYANLLDGSFSISQPTILEK